MANKVIMPKQGLQMTEGLITKWLIPEGADVKEGDPLFEMETDKLTITMDSNFTGILLKILKKEGETVPITETIAIIGEKGEKYTELLKDNEIPNSINRGEPDSIPAEQDSNPKESYDTLSGQVKDKSASSEPDSQPGDNRRKGDRLFATPRAKWRLEEKGIKMEEIDGTGPDGLIIERDVTGYKGVKATPVARKIAEQSDVSLRDVGNSGVNGKIMKADVIDYLQTRKATEQKETVIEISGMRKAIFNNMFISTHTMAQANHRMKVDMTEIVRFRQCLKENGVKIGFTDILVKVVSQALLKFPMLNASVVGNTIVQKHYVNMGIAVALENGLIVPNIKNSQCLSLETISQTIANLAKKAREGKLTPEEYTNGTFTITNLGMYDLDEFTAVINPPESAILAIGKIADTPVCVNKTVEIRPLLTLSLTYDHRIIDGAPAAEFLQYVKKLLQNPYLLI